MTAPAVHRDTPAGWAGPAGEYDRWFDEPWGRYAFAVEAATVLRAAGAIEGTRLLDAGCGTGRFGTALARRGSLVVGVDPDAGMLATARRRLPGRGLANHRRRRSGVWCPARFLNRAELRSLAAPHGASTLRAGLFAPGVVPALGVLGPALEALGTMAPALGAFQVIAIDRPPADG